MKPHTVRRTLWFANLGLIVAVVGLAAWFFLQVRPAVAKVTTRTAKQRPKQIMALRNEYESLRRSGLKWEPQAPVEEAEIQKVILRADYKKKSPTHWIFSGPMPPTKLATDKPKDDGPPPLAGLDLLGRISMILSNPATKERPDTTTVLFVFKGGEKRTRPFMVGEFVRLSKEDPGRFKLTAIKRVRPGVWDVTYAVFGKDPQKQASDGTLRYDSSGASKVYPFMRPVGAEAPTPVDPAGTGGTTAAPGAQPGATGSGPDGPLAGTEEAATPGTTPKVINAGSKPLAELTLKDLKPVVLRDPNNRNRRVIQFDRNTYTFMRGKSASKLAETMKTKVAKDSRGRVIGLQITGLTKDAPLDVFQVKRGDILVSINGRKISSRAEAISFVQTLSGHDIATVVIERNGKNITFRVDPRDPRTRRSVRYFEDWK